VSSSIVVMNQPVIGRPHCWTFPPHIFPQTSHNLNIKMSVTCLPLWNKFPINDSLFVKRTRSMLLTCLLTCLACLVWVSGDFSIGTTVAWFLGRSRRSKFHRQ
jgi:hypothetical protein